MKYCLKSTVVAVLLSLAFVIPLSASAFPVGKWVTISDRDGKARSIVKISNRGGVLSGRIVKVFPRRGDTGYCQNCPGRFKGKKVLGLNILWGVRHRGGNNWGGGRILDPKTGKIRNFIITRSGRVLEQISRHFEEIIGEYAGRVQQDVTYFYGVAPTYVTTGAARGRS